MIDKAAWNESLRKALDFAAGTGVLTQPEIDKVIADLINYNNPLRQNLPRIPGSGEAYIFNQRTAEGTAQFVNDTEEPADSQSTFKTPRPSLTYKTILYKGKVTTFLQKVGKSYKDLLAEEMEAALLFVKNKEEGAIITGDATARPKEFDGLRIQIPAGQQKSAGTNGGELSLALLDEVFDLCLGNPDLLLCSKRSRRELRSLLQATQRFVDTNEIKGGFRVMAYNDAAVLYSQFIVDDETQGEADNASSLYVLDTDHVFMSVLEELNMIRLAKTTSQFDAFDVRESETLVVKNPVYGTAWLGGIIPPTP